MPGDRERGRQETERGPGLPEDGGGAAAPRLLVVEDDRRLRELEADLLRGEGFRVETASDGEEGLRQLEEGFDLVVLDLNLPGMDGLELLERERRAGRDTAVVITTAEEAVGPAIRALRAGADDYLRKPVDPGDLLAAIGRILRQRGRGEGVPPSSRERILVEQARLEGWELARLEKEYLLSVLEMTGGNRTRTAEILGVDRRTVYRKLKEYEEEG